MINLWLSATEQFAYNIAKNADPRPRIQDDQSHIFIYQWITPVIRDRIGNLWRDDSGRVQSDFRSVDARLMRALRVDPINALRYE